MEKLTTYQKKLQRRKEYKKAFELIKNTSERSFF